jgi:hypothetical protein
LEHCHYCLEAMQGHGAFLLPLNRASTKWFFGF